MPMSEKKYDAFGTAVSKSLAAARRSQPSVAEDIGCSTGYLNNMITGDRVPKAKWVDLVADTLKLDAIARSDLHLAAARRAGYAIADSSLDLTKR